jgi:hypothetical protein
VPVVVKATEFTVPTAEPLFVKLKGSSDFFVLLAKNLNKFAPSDSLLIEKLVS